MAVILASSLSCSRRLSFKRTNVDCLTFRAVSWGLGKCIDARVPAVAILTGKYPC